MWHTNPLTGRKQANKKIKVPFLAGLWFNLHIELLVWSISLLFGAINTDLKNNIVQTSLHSFVLFILTIGITK